MFCDEVVMNEITPDGDVACDDADVVVELVVVGTEPR